MQQGRVDVFAVAEPERLDGDFPRHQPAAPHAGGEGERRGRRRLTQRRLVPVGHHLPQEGRVVAAQLLRVPLPRTESEGKRQTVQGARRH